MPKARLAYMYEARATWPKRSSVSFECVKRYDQKHPGQQKQVEDILNSVVNQLNMPPNAPLDDLADQIYTLMQQIGGNVYFIRASEGSSSIIVELIIEEDTP